MEKQGVIAEKSGSARADQLQFLRFLAFLNVFLTHGEIWNFFGYPASHCGTAAVSFFFMLGGLVTGYSGYGKSVSPTPVNICKDMWRKIRKVYPVFFMTQFVMILFSSVPAMAASGDFAGLGEFGLGFAKALLFLQTWPGVEAETLNGLTWFLSTMMFLYLLNLPAMWLIQKCKDNRFRYLIYGTAFCALMVAVTAYCYLTQNLQMSYWHYTFPPARMAEYLGGMLLGYSIRDFKKQEILKKIPGFLFTLAEIGALAFWVFSLDRAGNYWMNHIVSWLIPNTLLLTAFTFGMGYVSRIFRWKPLVWLGDISFECYLIHHIIILRYTVGNPVETMTLFNQVFSFSYCLLTTVLLAALVHRKPGTRK